MSRPTPEREVIIRLETLAMIEAALAFDDARVQEILHGSDCSPEARMVDAISLACYVIWRLNDPTAVLAELRAMAVAGDIAQAVQSVTAFQGPRLCGPRADAKWAGQRLGKLA